MRSSVRWLSFLSLLYFVVQLSSAQECQMAFQIEGHRPCGASYGPKDPQIIFPSSKDTTIVRSPDCRCYNIAGGAVNIRSPFSYAKVQVAFRMFLGSSVNQPQACINPDNNNCGGFGSCIFCDLCGLVEEESRRSGYNVVTLKRYGRTIFCNQTLSAGLQYGNELSVCLPPKDEILQMIDPNPETAQLIWNNLVDARGVRIMLFAYLFNEPVNQLSADELDYRIKTDRTGMVGCHWIWGRIFDPDRN